MYRYFKILLIVFFFSGFSYFSYSQIGSGIGSGIEFSKTKENFSFDMSIFGYVKSNYRIKISLGANELKTDKYNHESSNLSYISSLNAGVLVCTSVFGSLALNAIDKKDHKWKKVVLIPIIGSLAISQLLMNSQHNFTLLKTDSIVKNPLNLSIFAKSRFEYYLLHDYKWYQYRPCIGLELYKAFTKTKLGFTIGIGYEKPIDFAKNEIMYRELRPYGNIMLFYLIGK